MLKRACYTPCRHPQPYPFSAEIVFTPDRLANSAWLCHSSEAEVTNGKFGVQVFSWIFAQRLRHTSRSRAFLQPSRVYRLHCVNLIVGAVRICVRAFVDARNFKEVQQRETLPTADSFRVRWAIKRIRTEMIEVLPGER